MDYIAIITENGIPVYVEGDNDREYAKRIIHEVIEEYMMQRGGPNIKAYIWSTISGQVVWTLPWHPLDWSPGGSGGTYSTQE